MTSAKDIPAKPLQPRQSTSSTKRLYLGPALLVLLLPALLTACSGLDQINPTSRIHNVLLQPGDLEEGGIGLLTPSTVTGQEEDRQSVALSFNGVLQERRPGIRVVPLGDTLGAINRGGLADEYRQMFEDYRYTGVFKRETLEKIGKLANVRYLAQLKLANFRQDASGRLSVLGLRLVQTKAGNVRMLLTVWDSRDGSVAWEGMQELSYAYDTFREKPISFKQVVDEASKELVKKLP